MRILIAEDEVFIAENLAQIIRKMNHEVVDIIDTLEELKSHVISGSFDTAFLDIRMNAEDLGIQMAEILDKSNVPFSFITSFSDKSTLQKAISVRPHGYILKPFNSNDIKTQIELLERNFENQFVLLKSGVSSRRVNKSEIEYLESENVYVNVYLRDERIVVRGKLQEVLDLLDDEKFVRSHQSFAVNVDKIQAIESSIVMETGVKVPISRKFKGIVRTKISHI